MDRRLAQRVDSPPSVMRLIAWVTIAASVFLAANYGVNAYLHTIDKAPVRQQLRDAFSKGDLDVIKSRTDDEVLGVHQTTDCLVWDMAARDSTGNNLYLFAAAYTDREVRRGGAFGLCDALRDWLIGDPVQKFGEVWYVRYIFGYRVVADTLLLNYTVAEARVIMKRASYGVFILAIALNLAFAATAARRVGNFFSSNNFGYAVVSAGLMAFFGLPYFGQAITHAPSIVTLGLFLIAWGALDRMGRLTSRASVLAATMLGLFTAYFEFMTGYVPVGSCLLVAVVAVAWGSQTAARPWQVIHTLILCEMAFVGAILAAAALNMVVTALATDQGFQVFTLFWDRLVSRMARSAPAAVAGAVEINKLTLADVLDRLLSTLSHLSMLSQRAMATVVLASILLSAVVMYDMLFIDRRAALRLSTALAAGSFLPVCVWIFTFQNHTAIHAAFMVRILVVVPTAALIGLWSWWRTYAENPAAVRLPGPAGPVLQPMSGQPA